VKKDAISEDIGTDIYAMLARTFSENCLLDNESNATGLGLLFSGPQDLDIGHNRDTFPLVLPPQSNIVPEDLNGAKELDKQRTWRKVDIRNPSGANKKCAEA